MQTSDFMHTDDGGEASHDLAALQSQLRALGSDDLQRALGAIPVHELARALERALAPADSATPVDDPVEVAAEQASEERRKSRRMKQLRAGKIIYNNHMSVSNCEVRDLSSIGCRLTVESVSGIPDNFEMQILNGGSKYECEVAWRKFNMIGVRFIG
jgi:hypothetical protein